MGDVLDQLVEYWRRQGVASAVARATLDDTAQWEERFGVCLPRDLREYVTRVNGMLNGEQLEFGDDFMSFLPLSAMMPEAEWSKHYSEPDLFVIADFLISSYWWCVRLTPHVSEHSQIFVRGTKLALVASSLEEFLLAYMSGSKTIHPL
jgi:SMI1 / KNR4 family (SUKH-1)